MDCLQVKKRQKTVRTRGFVRFIDTVRRRETAEKQRFRSCPEKKPENRTKPRFCTVYSYGALWRRNGVVRFSLRKVEPYRRKTVQRGTAPNRTVRYITAPNRTVGFTISENRTEPHRRVYHSTEPHRRISKPHRTTP